MASEISAAWNFAAPSGPSRGIRRVLALPGTGARAKTPMAGEVLWMDDEEGLEAARCETQRFGINSPHRAASKARGLCALNEHLLVLRGLAHRRIPAPRKQKLEAFAHPRDHGRHFLDGATTLFSTAPAVFSALSTRLVPNWARRTICRRLGSKKTATT